MKTMLTTIMAVSALAGVALAEDHPDSASNVMFIHASPDGPSVDINCSDKTIDHQIGYSQTTGYQKIESGLQQINIHVADKDSVIVPAQVKFEKDTSYSVFVVDSVKKADLLVIKDHIATPPPGKAMVRFVNLVPDSPEFDLTRDKGKVIIPDRGFKEYSDFKEIDAGSHSFALRVAGTDSLVVQLPDVFLQSGKIYTVVVRGFIKGRGSEALKVEMIQNR